MSNQARKMVETRIQKSRSQELQNNEIRRRLVENNILAGHGFAEVRVEGMRRARSQAAERFDLFQDYQYVRNEQDKERRGRIAEAEGKLADELSKRQALKHREEMDRKRICDGSEELRALKERLHAAKVNKERAAQLLEIQVKAEKERLIEHRIAEHCENARQEAGELEHKLEYEKMKQRERVKRINQQQIAQKEAGRQEAMVEYMKEKQAVADMVAKIAEEDAQEKQARDSKKEESKQLLQRFMREQKERQKAMEQQELDELDAIEKYAADKRAREEEIARQKAEIEAEKLRIFQSQLSKAEERNRAAGEMEYLRNELHAQELEEIQKKKQEAAVRKHLEDREEMKNAYVYQMQLKEERKAKELAEEEKTRAVLLRKFADDDKEEAIKQAKYADLVAKYREEAKWHTQLKRQMYEESREKERHENEALRGEEGKRQIIIEAERQRLLREYAAPMKDFLPKGTLGTREDYDFVFGKQ
eukprot:gnl/TRDRNA2_/TRDRNA2_179731_c0_seq1.p1 gnl/TRDRNA2_/TRDRNA2_179731_c0~~gnl/TRDRNA2_/TRDRNA2_179731_c0_seq1.p1  ORF type:complete len:511 (+),score=169.32 gnl/TRDRNA2_/TRDRNA2_179731_c0_seq1:103-1533(+)